MTMSRAAAVVLLLAVALVSTTTTVAAARHHHHHHHGGFGKVFDRQEADLVEALPGQPAGLGVRQFSGYVTVNETHGRALFYWFFEATHDVSSKPLVLWLNGGPGCSSLGFGALEELGPLLIQNGTPELRLNPHAWNKEANLLFLEQPAGVGFSYTNTTADLERFGDDLAANDAYTFLVNWFERFPQFKGHDFYIAGESYAGHYVPHLAEKIVEQNKKVHKSKHINFKGFMIGNAAIDEASDNRGMVDYAWDHAVISDELYDAINANCRFDQAGNSSDFSSSGQNPPNAACDRAMNGFYEAFDHIDIYSLYTPACTANPSGAGAAGQLPRRLHRSSATQSDNSRPLRPRYNSYDPCLDNYVADYLNRRDVQDALHANTTGSIPYAWTACSDPLFQHWKDSPASTLPVIKRMVDAGLRVWVYSGDTDARVPVSSTRQALRKLGLKTLKQWREWFTSDQVGGYQVDYDGLTFVTIRGAGHMVPTVTPVQARQLFAHFLAAKELPPKPIVA
ncbi:serine carboxypeptidase-like 34 [Hordeum vulgare subsp. vulgare]|uniref:Carboxypeptidase n=1 Tax=Hordeum vulgare subsp. vulgare TaxID=112509 RepID=A0A8I7BF50_HORVV|nr:serine carboxypeptidase-like 34 [Hordeum vulgare subsp. vulgare]